MTPSKSRRKLLETPSCARRARPLAAGTVGTVVELFTSEALVEIADEHCQTLVLLRVPYETLLIRDSMPAGRHGTP